MASSSRRREIVEAALALLAELPVAELTTRRIAKRIGVSQPALFRHFQSREQILLGVVEHVRGELAQVASGVLEGHAPADEKLEGLASALLAHVEAHPGLPRLLFSDLSPDDPVGAALRQLVASQVGIVGELVRDGRDAGRFATGVDPRDAAALFVGMIQGLVLQWELGGRASPLAGRAPSLVSLFRDGLHGGDAHPRSAADQATPAEEATNRAQRGTPPATEVGPRADGLRALDVRPILQRGEDPLEQILAAVDAAGPSGLVALIAPFEPRPLLSLMRGRGHLVRCEKLDERVHAVEIVVGGAPEVLQLTDLEPPEPLERVLEGVERLGPGEVLIAHVPRFPRLLLPRLEERGVGVEAHERPDGSALVRVRRPA